MKDLFTQTKAIAWLPLASEWETTYFTIALDLFIETHGTDMLDLYFYSIAWRILTASEPSSQNLITLYRLNALLVMKQRGFIHEQALTLLLDHFINHEAIDLLLIYTDNGLFVKSEIQFLCTKKKAEYVHGFFRDEPVSALTKSMKTLSV